LAECWLSSEDLLKIPENDCLMSYLIDIQDLIAFFIPVANSSIDLLGSLALP
jgi:hypothetical protein